MLKVYGYDFSPASNKVKFFVNAIEIEYEFISVNLPKQEHKSEKYLSLHPAGKIPCIDDDGFILFESDAILKYLSLKNSSEYYPKNDFVAQTMVDQWCNFISIHIYSAIMRLLFNKVAIPKLGLEVDEVSIKAGKRFLRQFLPVIDQQLAKNKYLIGDQLTIADFALLSTVDPAEMIELDLSQYQSLSSWKKNLQSQEFYKKTHKFFGASIVFEK